MHVAGAMANSDLGLCLQTSLQMQPAYDSLCSLLLIPYLRSAATGKSCCWLQIDVQEDVTERMKEVFRMHGASAMASSDLGFVPADFPADAVTLLAPCGDLWGLKYDLRYPFAAWLAHQAALLSTGNRCHAHRQI